MTRPRKTVDVEDVRKLANSYLERSHDDRREQRLGVASLIEQVLMMTGNYKGFGYTIRDWQRDDSRRCYYR